MAAIWNHPFFGGGGFYVGSGGLHLFQVDVDGSITVQLGIEISGKASCTLTLPGASVVVPAGDLGAVLMQIQPKLTVEVSGKLDIQTSITLNCGVEYRWRDGTTYPNEYCVPHYEPLQLSADSGVDITATATLAANITLDDIVGVDGSLSAYLHAGYHALQHPIAEIDAGADFELGACLICFWKDSPARVTIASGEIFHKVLATYDTAPAAPPPPTVATTALPNGALDSPYSAQLHASDDRTGTWTIIAGTVPTGLSLNGDTISGVPTATGTSTFTVQFADNFGAIATATLSIDVVLDCSLSGACTTAFQAVTAPLPPSQYANDVVDIEYVSCGSVGFCAAAGTYFDASDTLQGVLETLSNGTWTATRAPAPAGTSSAAGIHFAAVSCTSDGVCVAVGYYSDSNGQAQGLIETYQNEAWSAQRAPLPADASTAPGARLSAISCAASSYCVAVGRYTDNAQLGRNLVDTIGNSGWTASSTPLPGNAGAQPGAWLHAVSCASAGWCQAVGYYQDSSHALHADAVTLTAASSTAVEVGPPSDAANNAVTVFNDISCPTTGFCGGSGSYTDSAGTSKGFLATGAVGSWSTVAAPVPAGAWPTPAPWIYHLSCPAAGSCFAVGTYDDSRDTTKALLDAYAGGAWQPDNIPIPAVGTYPVQLDGISCTATTACTAVGYYAVQQPDTGFGLPYPLAETLEGSTWTYTTPPLPDGVYNYGTELSGVSCAADKRCSAVGYYGDPAHNPVGLLESS
jgi:hypothetical protein